MDIMLSRILELIGNNHGNRKKLSDYLGFNGTSRISDWEAGRVKSYTKYAPKIAEYFGVSLDYLAGKTDIKGTEINSELKTIKPATDKGDGHTEVDPEIYAIVSQLSSDNRQKLIELGRMYLDFQQRNEGKK